MSTEAQRARNARKRAKLKAHKSARAAHAEDEAFVWVFGVRGSKNGFPPEAQDYVPGDTGVPAWVIECDHVSVCIVAPKNTDMDSLRSIVRDRTECVYGFNEHDLDVRLATSFPVRQDA